MFQPYILYMKSYRYYFTLLYRLSVWRHSSRTKISSLKEYAVGYTGITTSVLVCGILATSIGLVLL